MSQFDAQYDTTPQKRSGLAVASMVCSFIFFCPLTTLLAPLLGLIALATMGGDPPKRGKGMAVTGIALGIVFTTVQCILIFTVGAKGFGFLKEYIDFAMEGPNEALVLGTGGDITQFKLSFHGAGATASDAEAQAFLDELSFRYGAYISTESAQQGGQQQFGQPSARMPYVIEFDRGVVDAEVELVFADQSTGELLKKLGYILVFDADLGDLRYPPAEAATPGAVDADAEADGS